MALSETLRARLFDVVSSELGVPVDKIKLGDSFTDDLGADSLDLVELVMAFETEFEIVIADEDAEKCKTVQHVMDLAERLLEA